MIQRRSFSLAHRSWPKYFNVGGFIHMYISLGDMTQIVTVVARSSRCDIPYTIHGSSRDLTHTGVGWQ